jgi:hypothetical protein
MKGANPTEALEAMERMATFGERLRRGAEKRERRRAEKTKRTQQRRLNAVRPKAIVEEHEELREVWYRWPLAAQCEVCREKPADEAHHVVREQTLRAFARDRGYDFEKVRWDIRNRQLVCKEPCHEKHTNASQRIPVSMLRPDTLEFILEYGFEGQLEREYDHSEEVV